MARSVAAFILGSGLAALAAASEPSASVTPVEKVIALLENLKSDVEGEGRSEASTYDKFACWCKSTTSSKSEAITVGRDNINSLSATMQEKTALREEKEAELAKRQADHEAWTAEVADTRSRFEKARAEYDAAAADLSKAISSLQAAIQAMEASKPTPALLQTVESSLALARALDLITEARRRSVSALLQTGATVDPSDPSYVFHSQGIVDTLKQLLEEFTSEKRELDDEWSKEKATFESTIKGLEDKLASNSDAMDVLAGDISGLKGAFAEARLSLVSAEAMLKDDQLYMKDMTERCETRATEWDQRARMRADELEALAQALAILEGSVSSLDVAQAGARAMLLEARVSSNASTPAGMEGATLRSVAPHSAAALALFQEVLVSSGSRAALRGAQAAVLSLEAKQDKIATMLGQEGRRLRSTALAALAMKLAADPFAKVKTLIQQLVERLLAEATAEASKKGFCDEELGKAGKDRDFRHADSKRLDIELQGLNLKKSELEVEIELLTGGIEQLHRDLSTTTSQREEEKAQNLETIRQSKEGFAAVKEAINILKVFYARAGRAKVVLSQFSPIDEASASDAGFEGAYTGKQENAKGIIGLLQVIESDFDRTRRHTEEAEAKAHAEFIDFDRMARSDVSGKDTKKTLDEEDLETTRNSIASTMADLRTAQDLLDSALRRVEELKPTCIDTGMSYEDRVAKREEEIAALKRALCILGEPGCDA